MGRSFDQSDADERPCTTSGTHGYLDEKRMQGGEALSVQHREHARHATGDRTRRPTRGAIGHRLESVFLLFVLTAAMSIVIIQTR